MVGIWVRTAVRKIKRQGGETRLGDWKANQKATAIDKVYSNKIVTITIIIINMTGNTFI